jgi:hypothetical protein
MSLKALRAGLALSLGLAAAAAGVIPAAAVDGSGPVRVSIAVPIVAPEATTGIITADALEAYTRPLGLLTRQLDAVLNRPVAIGIDPMIIVSIRLLGDSAPPSAIAWLDLLERATNQVFPLTYADSDITLATQAGSPRVLGPESFDFAIDPALFAPRSTETPAPTATPAPDDPQLPPYPTTDDLLAWPYSLTGVAWPREGSVVAADLATITATDYTTTILSSQNLALASGSAAVVDIDGDRVLVSDSTVSAALNAATDATTPEQQATATAALLQSIAAAGSAQSGEVATVFATLDRTVPESGSHLADTLTALENDPAISLIPMSEAMATRSAPATVADLPQDPVRLAEVARMLEAESADRRFASVAQDPERITADRRLQLLSLLSSAWQSNPTAWTTAAGTYLEDSGALRSAIAVVESSSFNLVGDRGLLPIAVSNALDQPVTVYITVRPQTPLLAVEDERVELVIEPGAQATKQVPVQAVSNGTVELEVTLTSASNVQIGAQTFAEINVQAGWETPIVVVLAVIVVGVFGAGIVRNILRRRKTPADE